jgi:hypothetical protein
MSILVQREFRRRALKGESTVDDPADARPYGNDRLALHGRGRILGSVEFRSGRIAFG